MTTTILHGAFHGRAGYVVQIEQTPDGAHWFRVDVGLKGGATLRLRRAQIAQAEAEAAPLYRQKRAPE